MVGLRISKYGRTLARKFAHDANILTTNGQSDLLRIACGTLSRHKTVIPENGMDRTDRPIKQTHVKWTILEKKNEKHPK